MEPNKTEPPSAEDFKAEVLLADSYLLTKVHGRIGPDAVVPTVQGINTSGKPLFFNRRRDRSLR